MILILGDLLADLSLRIESFPVQAGGMQRVSYFELGPGGAANTAIAAAAPRAGRRASGRDRR